MYKKDIKEVILVERQEENFDKACEHAYSRACMLFGLNDAGIFERVEDAERDGQIPIG